MNDLTTLLTEAAESFRLLPAPAFDDLHRRASRRHRRRRAGLAATAAVICIGTGVGAYVAQSTAAPSAQLGATPAAFLRQGASAATVCVAAEPKVCSEWNRPAVARLEEAVDASPAMPVEATWPCEGFPDPYRNADITLHYTDGSDEVLNINTGCGFLRNNRTERFEQATPALVALIFSAN